MYPCILFSYDDFLEPRSELNKNWNDKIKEVFILNFTLFFIFRLIFLSDFSSDFVSGNLWGTVYPSEIKVRFSSSVRWRTPVAPFCKASKDIIAKGLQEYQSNEVGILQIHS